MGYKLCPSCPYTTCSQPPPSATRRSAWDIRPAFHKQPVVTSKEVAFQKYLQQVACTHLHSAVTWATKWAERPRRAIGALCRVEQEEGRTGETQSELGMSVWEEKCSCWTLLATLGRMLLRRSPDFFDVQRTIMAYSHNDEGYSVAPWRALIGTETQSLYGAWEESFLFNTWWG